MESTNHQRDSAPIHVPVLCNEIMQYAEASAGQTWMDGTAGGGGHLRLFAEAVGSSGQVYAFDRDPAAVKRLQDTLPEWVTVICDSYHRAVEHLESRQVQGLHGVLLDLGLSSDQLEDRERGFSFQTEGELDMRFNPEEGEPVWQWLRYVDEKTLADTIYQFGEERFSRRIARNIVERRRSQSIKTADELREIIYRSIPNARRATTGNRKHGRVDPATRTFQALRIAINDELGILKNAMDDIPNALAPGGLLMVISFHSLEDRIVKYAFREDPRLEVVTKKPIQATEQEVMLNPRSRSAKLRVARRIASEDLPC